MPRSASPRAAVTTRSCSRMSTWGSRCSWFSAAARTWSSPITSRLSSAISTAAWVGITLTSTAVGTRLTWYTTSWDINIFRYGHHAVPRERSCHAFATGGISVRRPSGFEPAASRWLEKDPLERLTDRQLVYSLTITFGRPDRKADHGFDAAAISLPSSNKAATGSL